MSGAEQSAESDALRERVEALATRYENTSPASWSRPDVIAHNLRTILAETADGPTNPPGQPT